MFWFILLNFTLLPAALTGLARWRVVGRDWTPFILLLWIGLINECLSLYRYLHGLNPAPNNNIYTLLEFLFLLWQFGRWHPARVRLYVLCAVAGTLTWVLDNLVLHTLSRDNGLFRAAYGFTLVILSMEQANIRLLDATPPYRRDPVLLACCGFLLYFSCRAFLEIWHLVGFRFSERFQVGLTLLEDVVNAVTNIIYLTALLCIPAKQRFLWRSRRQP